MPDRVRDARTGGPTDATYTTVISRELPATLNALTMLLALSAFLGVLFVGWRAEERAKVSAAREATMLERHATMVERYELIDKRLTQIQGHVMAIQAKLARAEREEGE